jgi:hypothetical protein
MDDDLFVVVLAGGRLSPAEDLETSVVAATQEQTLGHSVLRIERGGKVVLEGKDLRAALSQREAPFPIFSPARYNLTWSHQQKGGGARRSDSAASLAHNVRVRRP